MSLIPEFGLAPHEDDEGLFSRDIDGQLVRLDPATDDDYKRLVGLHVDGRSVQVPKAEPLKDAQGNIVLDMTGRTTPRYTTILEAVAKLNADRDEGETEISIPTLCHQAHMTPVAVCRLCVVQIYGQKRGHRAPERKLLPACQHQVKDGMEVFTKDALGRDGDRVRRAVNTLTELLMADHLKPAPTPALAEELAPFNELQQLADGCGLSRSRFALAPLAAPFGTLPVLGPPTGRRMLDSSSPVFIVDHSACILCDRCIRACNEVKNNHVIGRTGKGRTAGIGFDLNDKMFGSTCVQCGECMVSCPTSAITFKPFGLVKIQTGPSAELVPLAELKRDPLFASVPAKFLLWQKGLVLRRHLKAGDVLCREGEPGHSAFIIKSGRLQVTQRGAKPITRTVDDVIVGEMACLSGTPRTADVLSLEVGEVWELRRNVLDRMMRSPSQRKRFEQLYRDRALTTTLCTSELFLGLGDEYSVLIDFLKPLLKFVCVSPGQLIMRQGELADCFYLIRLGHVRVGFNRYGREVTYLYRGAGTIIGEIGLLAISRDDGDRSANDVCRDFRAVLGNVNLHGSSVALPAGRRTATCSALDHVELARVSREDFLEIVRQFPRLCRNLVKIAQQRLRKDWLRDRSIWV
jgi:CRP-like cAMP-binding protein/NAD-dependent dihydropyrimidine dehydrogenase PreA subunit